MDAGSAREVKVVLLGEAGVGKSSLVLRFVTGSFDKYSEATIGASFMSKLINVDGAPIKYQIWDTAGACPGHFCGQRQGQREGCGRPQPWARLHGRGLECALGLPALDPMRAHSLNALSLSHTHTTSRFCCCLCH